MSCTKCNKSHSTVQAFLLTCYDCKRKWHHRKCPPQIAKRSNRCGSLPKGCHLPPVPDQELVNRIKARNAGDKANGLQAWRCKYCTEGGTIRESDTRGPTPTPNARPQSISQSASSRDPSSLHPSMHSLPSGAVQTSSKRVKSNKVHEVKEVVVIHDSDSDTPPSKPSKPAKASILDPGLPATLSGLPSTIKKANKSIPRPSKAVHPLAQEEEESSDSAKNPPLLHQRYTQPTLDRPSSSSQPIRSAANDTTTTQPRKKRASENVIGQSQKEIILTQPLSQEEKERQREVYKRQAAENEKRRRFEHRKRQQELVRAKSEEKEPQFERATLDLTLETPGKPSEAHIQDTVSHLLESPGAATPGADTQASPIIISVTRAVAEKYLQKERELNLLPQWILARKSGRDVWDWSAQKKACKAPSSQSRRKFRAQKLGDIQPHIYHFDSTHWVDRMKRGPR